MTGMFEAYPVDESARPSWIGLVFTARVIPRTPSVTRDTHDAAGCPAADASEHGGRIFIMAPIFEAKRRKSNSPISLSLMRFSDNLPFTEKYM
ncbi:hypothetical protein [Paraburkholderia xenovorans]|jgi:hypothetical protein|uniref:hypothetical protein n=1 Tax=Paraburkholderia xenovorans TaxID=36873 RepID=UPI0015C55DB5|nr:hypothetical protein [Paraburkholderia xenovorans]NPT37175.1 hypothetical protein [Paraburkholderia xenovorans]